MGYICNHDYEQGGCSICQSRDEENYQIRLKNEEAARHRRWDRDHPYIEPQRKSCQCVFEYEVYCRADLESRVCQTNRWDTHEQWLNREAMELYRAGKLKVGGKPIDVTYDAFYAFKITLLVPVPKFKLTRLDPKPERDLTGYADWYRHTLDKEEATSFVEAAKRIHNQGYGHGCEPIFEIHQNYSKYRVKVIQP